MGCGASTAPSENAPDRGAERKYKRGKDKEHPDDATPSPAAGPGDKERRRVSLARSDSAMESSRSQHREGSVTDDDVGSVVGTDSGAKVDGSHDPANSLTAKELARQNDPAIPLWLDDVLCASMALSILEEHLADKEAMSAAANNPHQEFMVPDFSLDRPMDELNGSVTAPAHQSVANTARPPSAPAYCPNASVSTTASVSVTTAAHGSLTIAPALSPFNRVPSSQGLVRRGLGESGSFSEPPRSALEQTMTAPSDSATSGLHRASSSLPDTAPCTPNNYHLATEASPAGHGGNGAPFIKSSDNMNPSLAMESSGTTDAGIMRGSSFRTPSERSVSGGSAMGSVREKDEDLFEGALATTPKTRSLCKGTVTTESMQMAIGICKAVMAAPAAARARFTSSTTVGSSGDPEPVITLHVAPGSNQGATLQSSPLQRKRELSSYSLKSSSTVIVPMVDASTDEMDEELLRALATSRPLPACARAMLPTEILRRRAAMLARPSVQYEPAVLSTNNLLRWEQEVDRSVMLAVAERRGVPAGLLSMTPLELAHAGVEDYEVFIALAEVHSGGCDGPAFMPSHPLWHRTGCASWCAALLRHIALETFNPFRLDAANKRGELPRQGRWAHSLEASTLLRRFPTLQEGGSLARRIISQGQSAPNGSTSVNQAKTSTTSVASLRPVSASHRAAIINQRPLAPAVRRPTSAAPRASLSPSESALSLQPVATSPDPARPVETGAEKPAVAT